MSYKTVEVELENGRVLPRGNATLPARAHALLTILDPNIDSSLPTVASTAAGLQRFLSAPDFTLTPEQFRISMEADFFEQ